MNELTQRILFAVPSAALFLYLAWLGGWIFAAAVILITLFMQHEVCTISTGAGFRPDSFFCYVFALWLLLMPYLSWSFEVGVALFLIFVGRQVFRQTQTHIQELVSTLFFGLYAPLGMVMLLLIRDAGTGEAGFTLLLALLLMVWGNDICAYFGGRHLGSRTMAPTVSPKKTWEGFLFGILGAFASLAIVLYAVPLAFPVPLVQALPLVLLVSLFGPLGDLAESKLKRAAGVKDSSSILPGHGGVFDRFDALILAAPAFYLYIRYLEIAGYVSF